MKRHTYYLYAHGGSGNHGCEAIVRTTAAMLGETPLLFSFRPEEDCKYGVDQVLDLSPYSKNVKTNHPIGYYPWRVWKALRKGSTILQRRLNRDILREGRRSRVVLSVGGDNYCYGEPTWLMQLNRMFRKQGKQTVLWGCSVEPDLLSLPSVREDLNRYSLIVARESITFEALKAAGITAPLCLYPDPAFTLPKGTYTLPQSKHGFVGLNFSNYALKTAPNTELAHRCMRHTVDYIVNETPYDVLLIPHVVWGGKNDLDLLRPLYEQYRDSGRVYLVEDCGCQELKAAIAGCRFFIGARTHSTIAAYSSMVPTLVLGYSVKAKGIARDLFGTETGYVLPCETLTREEDITVAFQFLEQNEGAIRTRLQKRIPAYIQDAYKAADEVKALLGESNA